MTMPTILIIIGITGDLSRRYLLPAVEEIAKAGELPEKFRIIGVSRQPLVAEDVLKEVHGSTDFLQAHLEMVQLNLAVLEDYRVLEAAIRAVEIELGTAQRLYYLSIPPQASLPVIELLGESGLSRAANTKLLLEKPFGTDLASANELVVHTQKFFTEEQVYRIDHYLAKEMAQNIMIFRQANPLLRHTWNKDFIDNIEIRATESIGVEGRSVFYEQTGAVRDVLQSHLLQLAALTLMDDASSQRDSIPMKRLHALQSLHLPADKTLTFYARRGQYEGYREEVGNVKSMAETYASIALRSSDPKWSGVPIQLVTGKAMSDKQTVIRIQYRSELGFEPNELQMRIQPEAGIMLKLWSKVPGYTPKIHQQSLSFDYSQSYTALPNAYEQVFLDVIRSDHTLFASSAEVMESWRIVDPILRHWSMSEDGLLIYPKGTDPSFS